MTGKKHIDILLKIISFIGFFILMAPLSIAEGGMTDYCVTPPFLAQIIPPSVLIMLDNSGSMRGQAYSGAYDSALFSQGYYGYFDASKNYKYTGNNRWEETTEPITNGTVTNPIANGSFLNWATMERVEVAKKLLIGGKANPRSPSGAVTVKLDAETSGSFNKDFDNTAAPNLIYPFTGNYRYTRSGNQFEIRPVTAGTNTEDVYPTSDVSVPAAWTVTGAASAWDAVNEVSADGDTTYIQNTTTNVNDQVILDYRPYTPTISGTIINVTVLVRAKKTGTSTNQTRRIQGALRFKTAGVDLDDLSSYSSLSTSYTNHTFSWATNPYTGLAWQWTDLTGNGVGSLKGFGVKSYSNPNASNYPRVTQIYLIITVGNPSGGPYNIIVDQGLTKAEGIIDRLSNDVKFGLAYYNSSEGGNIDTYVDFGTPTNMVTSISNMVPSTWTPLGETLYEMTRYFRQDAPYYSNSPADYQLGSGSVSSTLYRDPFWYKYSSISAGLTDRYVPCAKAFILFLTDGESTMDQNFPASLQGYSTGYRFAGTPVGQTYASSGTDYMIDAAFWARTNDTRPGACTTTPTSWQQCIPGNQYITVYPVFLFGRGSTLLKDVAIDGGFEDINGNNLPDCNTLPEECYRDTSGDGVVSRAYCSNNASALCAADSDCTAPGTCVHPDDPKTYYEGDDGYELETNITNAINDILKRASSGTAASVLASGEGSGANLVQAVFYPKKRFYDTSIEWIGWLQNLWYYIDPDFSYSNIREEGGVTKDYKLNLLADGTADTKKDYILQLFFDKDALKARAKRYSDTTGTGASVAQIDTIDFEELGNLWEAGKLLWNKTASARNIYTSLTATYPKSLTAAANAFSTANLATLRPLLNTDVDAPLRTVAEKDTAAANIINYIRGVDLASYTAGGVTDYYRSRTVSIDLNGDGDILDPVVTVSGVSMDERTAKVWKLGDIVNSTPRISSWLKMHDYDGVYGDTAYTDFVNSATYVNRGMVFTGANDGMLHAFKLGKLEVKNSATCTLGTYDKACLTNPDITTDRGEEIWTFIPKSVLPYLKYLKEQNYCHVYYVDLTPVLVDVSIYKDMTIPASDHPSGCDDATHYWNCKKTANSWATILIGGMRTGGACKFSGTACTECVNSPVSDNGLSTYFAIDITDQNNPKLLWEFSNEDLGFATGGPAVVRISSRTAGATNSSPDKGKTNGRWFVVLGSGPTGPIDTGTQQFLGKSSQPLKIFILDLKDGSLLRTIGMTDSGTVISDAFAGSLIYAAHDSVRDLDYQDDVVYIGYTKKNAAAGTWTDGGVLRLMTNEDLDSNTEANTAIYPANWKLTEAISGTGPITTSVQRLENYTRGVLRLYFGSGRYFFKQGAIADDPSNIRQLYAIKEPCYSGAAGYIPTCAAAVSLGSPLCSNPAAGCTLPSWSGNVKNVTNVANALTSSELTTADGWYINLDPAGNYTYLESGVNVTSYYDAERMITDPVTSPIGIVFYTSFKPSGDECRFGGKTFIWAVKYDTGEAPLNLLQGKALIQVSTGSIEQVDLANAFTDGGGRKTAAIEGVPPTSQGLSILVGQTPIKRILHIKAR